MKVNILGVAFDALTLDEAEARINALLLKKKGGAVVTANPEIVLRCRDDAAYAAAVNGAELVLADGVGDLYAARILGTPLPDFVSPERKMGIFPMKRRFSPRGKNNSPIFSCLVSARRGRSFGWRRTAGT